jgi:hypothetical protein
MARRNRGGEAKDSWKKLSVAFVADKQKPTNLVGFERELPPRS